MTLPWVLLKKSNIEGSWTNLKILFLNFKKLKKIYPKKYGSIVFKRPALWKLHDAKTFNNFPQALMDPTKMVSWPDGLNI